jgi:Fe-S-cluster containining protein
VYLSGDEIVRIARTLDTPPWTFTTALPALPGDDAFALDDTADRYRAALTKLPAGRAGESCIFLLRLSEGTARCGLGESRPAPCRAYPAEGCTCSARSTENAVPETGRDEYARIVRTWNAYVNGAGIKRFSFTDFCRFLLDQYAAIA